MAHYRLTKDFGAHYNASNVPWPDIRKLNSHVLASGGVRGFENNSIAKLKRGKPVPERCMRAVIDYLVQSEPTGGDPDIRRRNEIVDSFMIQRVGHSSRDVDALLGALAQVAKPSQFLRTIIGSGLKPFMALFRWTAHPEKYMRACRDEAEVHEAVEWMYVALGRAIRPEGACREEAIELASERMQIGLEDYQRQAATWWRVNPATVVVADDGGERRGMGIALPLKDSAYMAVRSGQQKSYECLAADIEPSSPNLLIEALATAPPKKGNKVVAFGRALYCAALCQHAHLTDHATGESEFWMRTLTFAVTPAMEKWLVDCRYEPTGATMAGTDIPIYERYREPEAEGAFEAMLLGIWRLLQQRTRTALRDRTGQAA